jgi:hypothetical protein
MTDEPGPALREAAASPFSTYPPFVVLHVPRERGM